VNYTYSSTFFNNKQLELAVTPTTTPPSSKNGVAASNDPNKGSSCKNGVAASNHPNDNKGSITLELPADGAGEAMRSEVHDIGGFSWLVWVLVTVVNGLKLVLSTLTHHSNIIKKLKNDKLFYF
jgi:hypothetical protein